MVPEKMGKENGMGGWIVFLSSANSQQAWPYRANMVMYKNSGKKCDDQVWKGHSKLVEDLNGFKMWCFIHLHVCLSATAVSESSY